MIRNSTLSKEKLGKFFMSSPDFTELNVPELTRFSNITINNLIINNENLTNINLPALEQQPGIILGENLRTINLPSLQYITNNSDVLNGGILTSKFLQNTKLQSLDLPELHGTLSEENDLSSASQIGFARNYWLKEVSLGNAYLKQTQGASFGKFWFYYNFSLQKLILRYPFVIPLSNITGLATTPIGSGGKGFIYVPDNLIEDYQRAGSWANFSAQFRPITSLENPSSADKEILEEDTITDSWSTIIENCNNGNLSGQYVVGATKTIEIDGMPTQMVIVDLNKDELADDSGNTAMITWMEKHIARYKPIYMSVTQGDIRNYSNITNFHEIEKPKIFAGLPTVVRNGIKTVKKKTFGWVTIDGQSTMETSEQIWLPSAAELNLQQSAARQIESDEPYNYFSGTENIGHNVFKFGKTNRTSPSDMNNVALRTFTSQANYADSIDNNGRFVSGENSQFPQYLIIGFCT